MFDNSFERLSPLARLYLASVESGNQMLESFERDLHRYGGLRFGLYCTVLLPATACCHPCEIELIWDLRFGRLSSEMLACRNESSQDIMMWPFSKKYNYITSSTVVVSWSSLSVLLDFCLHQAQIYLQFQINHLDCYAIVSGCQFLITVFSSP